MSAFLIATKMALGASLVPIGLFIVISGRDQARHLLGVRFAILVAVLFLTVSLYAGTVLYDEFSQALGGWSFMASSADCSSFSIRGRRLETESR